MFEAELADAAPVHSTRQQIRQQAIAALNMRMPHMPKAEEYRNGILLVNGGLIAIPVIGFMMLLTALAIAFASGLFICLVPLLLLFFLVAVAAMTKPFLAARSQSRKNRAMAWQGEPFLYEFVCRLSDAVGAPRPVRIDVDFDVNASAHFESQNQFVLTLGLPLVAGMSLRQVAGVIAHELGHFTQTEGMKTTRRALQITRWFHSVVYERDAFDYWLDYEVATGNVLCILLKLFVGITRVIMYVLMHFSYALCSLLLRRMEFDADRYEIFLVGSKVFESTVYRLSHLGAATSLSFKNLLDYFRQQQLSDNFPNSIATGVERLSPDHIQSIKHKIETETTGRFDTHPADSERIQQARHENTEGVFRVNGPASILFEDFDQLCKYVTIDMYRRIFGEKFRASEVKSIQEPVVNAQQLTVDKEAIDARLLGVFHPLRPLRLVDTFFVEHEEDLEARKQTLQQARQQILQQRGAYLQAANHFNQLNQRIWEAQQAIAGYRIAELSGGQFMAVVQSRIDAMKDKENAAQQLHQLESKLQPAEIAQGQRMSTALELLTSGDIAVPDSEQLKQECENILAIIQTMGGMLEAARNLRLTIVGQEAAVKMITNQNVNHGVIEHVLENSRLMSIQVREMRRLLDVIDYPFTHESRRMTVGNYLMTHAIGNESFGIFEHPVEFCHNCDLFLDGFHDLYAVMVGRLAKALEQVELAAGFPPLTAAE